MLDAFISTVKSLGLARTNRFIVDISFPNGSRFNSPVLASLLCEASGLPGYNVSTYPHKIFGESREVPYEPLYEPIQMMFYIDSKFIIKDAFESWMSYIIDPITKTNGYYNYYTSTIDITIENIDGSTPYMVTLYEAYPKTMG